MATSTSSSTAVLDVLRRAFPSTVTSSTSETDVPQLSSTIYPKVTYTDAEKTEISQWIATSSRLNSSDEDAAKHNERLGKINTHLSTRTTLLGSKPCVADAALYVHLAPVVSKWTPQERTGEHGYHHIVRYLDFVQNAPIFGLNIPDEEKIKIDVNDVQFAIKPIDHKAEKEMKKKAAAQAAANGDDQKELVVGQGKEEHGKKSKKEKVKEAAEHVKEVVKGAAAGEGAQKQKKEKKEKQKKQKEPPKETPLSPCLIDLRVGHILKAIAHPNADSLYVSTITCGDPAGTDNTSEYEGQIVRTVCSGLNGLVPLEEMQGRKVITVCNLKPVTMRGIKSAAMVLAASPRVAEGGDSHAGPVELVNPPADSSAGERVYFEGWQGEPEKVLAPKKKIWETIQPGFTTTDGLEVAFDMEVVSQLNTDENKAKTKVGKLVTASGGICTVKSLKGATVR
ncbi:MAG: G4 quadruplex nucleic acid binding protein [Cirrosporium novae-zelandiae]|nr:MAG: G4 quadruplex nucleic acid binding protein [Cirrosporium novae-zelandiae]